MIDVVVEDRAAVKPLQWILLCESLQVGGVNFRIVENAASPLRLVAITPHFCDFVMLGPESSKLRRLLLSHSLPHNCILEHKETAQKRTFTHHKVLGR